MTEEHIKCELCSSVLELVPVEDRYFCLSCLKEGAAKTGARRQEEERGHTSVVCPYYKACDVHKQQRKEGVSARVIEATCEECRAEEIPAFVEHLDDTIEEMVKVRDKLQAIVIRSDVDEEQQEETVEEDLDTEGESEGVGEGSVPDPDSLDPGSAGA